MANIDSINTETKVDFYDFANNVRGEVFDGLALLDGAERILEGHEDADSSELLSRVSTLMRMTGEKLDAIKEMMDGGWLDYCAKPTE